MRLIFALPLVAAIGTAPALAAELPSRKPGLWELTMTSDNPNMPGQSMKQCIDAATDRPLQTGGPMAAENLCSRRDVQRSGTTITVDSTCTVAGKTMNSHVVITGSFDSAYTMAVTNESAILPGGKHSLTMNAKWLGPCAADQKPGDVILGNGMKFNPGDLQKRLPAGLLPPSR